MQNAKFIDVTRTYIPTDPNSFPTTMHGTGAEDSPENRIPAMAYEGHNFLPTYYGYKSYFGTNQEIGIDALVAKVDFILMYQNTNFENILIALTDTGIWTKRASSSGAWTQSLVVVAPVDPAVHYDWTYVVISQVLYCYQQNAANYQKIVSDITNGIVLTSVVPNTLNMAAQMGIFRAGGRLGFWDSADSVSWSNQDDYSDFVTSVLTLAGSQKFIDVNGRIVIIRGHGPGFIIYCTKSIIFVYPSSNVTMQWQPQVIFSNNGVVYSRMCVESSPDTTHYAYTDSGLYKIESAKEEAIVTEVTDTLAKHDGPVYLSMLEGRYLCLEILDPNFLEGMVQFTEGSTEALTYVWPGASSTLQSATDAEVLAGTNLCATIGAMGSGQFATKPIVGDQMPGTSFKAIWTAYLSNSGNKDTSNVTWTNTPQATVDPNGAEKNQCPAGNANKSSQLTTSSTNKSVVTGAAAYVDGIWTMERFVAAQTAIWELEEANINAWFNTIEARQATVVKVSYAGTFAGDSFTVDKGLIGRYVSRFASPIFSYSPCEFRLTRYCIQAKDVYRIKKNIIKGIDRRTPAAIYGYALTWGTMEADTITVYPDLAAAFAAAGKTPANPPPTHGGGLDTYYFSPSVRSVYVTGPYAIVESPYLMYISTVYFTGAGNTHQVVTITGTGPTNTNVIWVIPNTGRFEITETMIATNSSEDVDIGPIADTGYVTLSNWSYTNNGGGTTTVAAAACGASQIAPSSPYATPQVSGEGSFCSIPFTPVTIPGAPSLAIEWPSESLTIPSGTFLLQNGSIAPKYPTFQGFLVYDLKLKKWGKFKGLYKSLLNYQPINNSLNGVVSYASFGILGGILAVGGKIKLFDAYPSDSYITYGKIGYYRLGITALEEVRVSFASPSTGYVKTDSSITGRFVDPLLAKIKAFTDASSVTLTGGYPGSWCNITISGIYDINYLEFRGLKQGRR